jgi:O-antigen ligase
MHSSTWKQIVLPASIAAAGFFIPIWIPGTTLFLVIGLLSLPIARQQLQNPFRREIRWFSIFSTAIVVWQLIGLFYTQDLENGWFNLQQKLPILFFALLFGSIPPLSQTWIGRIKVSYISGALFTCIYLFAAAIQHYSVYHDPGAFLYIKLSPHLHPSYLALYLSVALLFCFDGMSNSESKTQFSFWGLVTVMCYLFIVLLQSKAGLIGGTAVLLFGAILLVVRKRLWLAGIAFAFIAFLLNTGLNYVLDGQLNARLKQAYQALNEPSNKSENKDDYKDSSQLRIEVWQSCVKVIKQHPIIGVGSGDVREVLRAEYQKSTYTIAADKHLNAHNQFLQQQIAGGVFALIFLLAWIILSATGSSHSFKLEAWIIPALILWNLLPESMLESQWGVLPIAFFLNLNKVMFANSHPKSKPSHPNQATIFTA